MNDRIENPSVDDLDTAQCPNCGRAVSRTITEHEGATQLAVSTLQCPHCGATLARDVDGPADRGWRLAS